MFTTLITQWDEGFSPPDQPVLEVDVIGDQVFLTISKYEETDKVRTLTKVATCGVGYQELVMALRTAAVADRVQRNRPKEKYKASGGDDNGS